MTNSKPCSRSRSRLALAVGLSGLLGACAAQHAEAPKAAEVTSPAAPASPSAPSGKDQAVSDAVRQVLAAPDRTEEDRQLDSGRRSAELLTFLGVGPGQKVAELGAGRGYTAELLARLVGPTGKVYVHNAPRLLKMFAEKPLAERMQRPAMQVAVRADREFDDPLPPEAQSLDAAVMVLFYHDTVWMGTDRDKMNRAVFAALRPGGTYLIVDHSGRAGTGTSESQTLHRIEESVVRAEIEKAGFRLAATADFLRSPADTRDWNDSPRAAGDKRGTSDRFVLKFVKP